MRATSITDKTGINRIKNFFAFPLKRGSNKAPMKKKIAGCIHLSIEILVLPKKEMGNALCYLYKNETSHNAKDSPESIDLIDKVVGIVSR
jgi:hypothetical protein